MRNKILICIILFVFVIVFSGFSESKINFYGGGGLATLGMTEWIPPIIPGPSMEAFFSYSFFAAHISIDCFTNFYDTANFFPSIELGLTYPVKNKFQLYLGTGITGFLILSKLDDHRSLDILMSLTAACYFKFKQHFGMGLGCTFGFPFEKYTFFDHEYYSVYIMPRITFGWKF